ncbi:unnamed protein product [Prorocentrum cordatum]|uniref:Anoctamin transmembrane domain-containing protein n=1 Tax=Prorocentrum cordatum TaxID=2364126 RepID=A0ABN9X891_9DINO|nr:unnamed protein product [Polarella glacialis]
MALPVTCVRAQPAEPRALRQSRALAVLGCADAPLETEFSREDLGPVAAHLQGHRAGECNLFGLVERGHVVDAVPVPAGAEPCGPDRADSLGWVPWLPWWVSGADGYLGLGLSVHFAFAHHAIAWLCAPALLGLLASLLRSQYDSAGDEVLLVYACAVSCCLAGAFSSWARWQKRMALQWGFVPEKARRRAAGSAAGAPAEAPRGAAGCCRRVLAPAAVLAASLGLLPVGGVHGGVCVVEGVFVLGPLLRGIARHLVTLRLCDTQAKATVSYARMAVVLQFVNACSMLFCVAFAAEDDWPCPDSWPCGTTEVGEE